MQRAKDGGFTNRFTRFPVEKHQPRPLPHRKKEFNSDTDIERAKECGEVCPVEGYNHITGDTTRA